MIFKKSDNILILVDAPLPAARHSCDNESLIPQTVQKRPVAYSPLVLSEDANALKVENGEKYHLNSSSDADNMNSNLGGVGHVYFSEEIQSTLE